MIKSANENSRCSGSNESPAVIACPVPAVANAVKAS